MVTTLPRYNEWIRRVKFARSAKMSIGLAAEYWDTDAANYDGSDALRDRLAALGRPADDLAGELSRGLLDETLAAAGGVERALHVLRSDVAALVAARTKWAGGFDPVVPTGIVDNSSVDAWYGFADVMIWARTLEERLDRRSSDNSPRNQGLIPAIRPPDLAAQGRALLDQLRSGPVGEARRLVNFTLHAGLVANPNSGARLVDSGSISLPIPDPPSERVDNWYLLTWDQHRDGIAFAEELWESVQTFMDDLLTAFEAATPDRLRMDRDSAVR